MSAHRRLTRFPAAGAYAAALAFVAFATGCGAGASEADQDTQAVKRVRPPPAPAPTPPPPSTGSAAIAWQTQLVGPYSSVRPAIGPDGTIYAIDVLGNLYAVTPAGAIKWQLANAGDKGLAVGPDGTVYVGSEDAVKAFAPDGTAVWTFTQSPRAFILLGLAVGPDGNVYGVATQGIGVFSLTPQGALRWATAETYDRPNVSYGEIVFGTARGEPQLYFHANNHVRAVTLSGAPVFTIAGGSQPAVSPLDGSVHVGDSAYGSDGSLLWQFGLSVGGPVDVGPDGATYFDFLQSAAYAVSPSGAKIWSTSVSDWIQGPVVDPGNTKVVFLANDPTTFAAVLVGIGTSGAPLFRLAFPAVGGVKQTIDTRVRFDATGTTAYVITDVNTSVFSTSHAFLSAVTL